MKKNYLILFYLNVLVTNKIVKFFVKSSRKRPTHSQYLVNGRLWQPILEDDRAICSCDHFYGFPRWWFTRALT